MMESGGASNRGTNPLKQIVGILSRCVSELCVGGYICRQPDDLTKPATLLGHRGLALLAGRQHVVLRAAHSRRQDLKLTANDQQRPSRIDAIRSRASSRSWRRTRIRNHSEVRHNKPELIVGHTARIDADRNRIAESLVVLRLHPQPEFHANSLPPPLRWRRKRESDRASRASGNLSSLRVSRWARLPRSERSLRLLRSCVEMRAIKR